MSMKIIFKVFLLIILSKHYSFSQSKNHPQMKNVKTFSVSIPQQELNDFKTRLQNARWPGEAEDSGWNFGTSEAYLKSLTQYWLTQYDWKKQEALLNKYPQFIAEVDGINIHFQYIKGKGKTSKPLILTH